MNKKANALEYEILVFWSESILTAKKLFFILSLCI